MDANESQQHSSLANRIRDDALAVLSAQAHRLSAAERTRIGEISALLAQLSLAHLVGDKPTEREQQLASAALANLRATGQVLAAQAITDAAARILRTALAVLTRL